MTEELPRFVYLRATCCKAWLAMYGLPSHTEPELAQRAPSAGWQQQPDGTWVCDERQTGKHDGENK